MRETLSDPDKPAHAIIEVLEDGDAIRNDGVRLHAANKNPWYVLATIHGEAETAGLGRFDEQNRNTWNTWQSGMIGPEARRELTSLYRARSKDETAEIPDRARQINFSNTYFPNILQCNEFEFRQTVLFVSSVFERSANFVSAQFSKNANFHSATFIGEANFNSANFKTSSTSGVSFRRAHFGRGAFFRATIFTEDADFKSAEFCDEAEFSSSQFKSTTTFEEARFLTHVPEFHAAELYDDTAFTLPDEYSENWPLIVGDGVMAADKQKKAYNRLRYYMSKSLQIDEEQFFHRMEMRCKRETENSKAMKLLYDLFEGVSDFGNSVWRPVFWLRVVWLSGTIAKLDAVKGTYWPDWLSIPQAMGWSFANLFSFFGFYRRYFKGETLNDVLQLFSATQTVFGFVLLFLLGLGLRNRFRLR